MREFRRVKLLLAGTALALLATAAPATSEGLSGIETAVPLPEPADVPPPTAADVTGELNAGTPVPAPARIELAVPLPEPANIPPPTAADVAGKLNTVTPASVPARTEFAVPVPEPANVPPPTAAAALSEKDRQVAEKLRELLAGKGDRMLERKSRAAVEAFYAARGYAPLWIDNGSASAAAKAAAAYLAKVDAEGLDPADYPLPAIKPEADSATLAEAELRFTATVLAYARHAQLGRVHYSRVSGDIFYEQVAPQPGDVLAKMTDAKSVASALGSFNPPHAGYRALKAKLAELRAAKGEPAQQRIAHGPVLKMARTPMHDERVPLLRERLGVPGDKSSTAYDRAVAEAVKKFQQLHGLSPNGQLTAATVDALNGPKRDRQIDIIIANMERWRWLPRDLGRAYVMVNIPDFTLKVVNNGQTVWSTRIVVGKPGRHATPLLSETMKYITVNPTWNVPPSIVNNEYLPALQEDPTVLDRMGLKLVQNRDGSVHIYQPPGEGNALGRLRFNFPNKFLVYQHDTPDKHLFSHEVRAYSHGCMRVQNPDKYAEVLLSIANPKDGYTVERIRSMYGTGEKDIRLQTHIPVHLTYQTAFVDEAGKLHFRNDIYGRDARILAILKGDERKVADVAVEHRQASTGNKPARLPPSYSVASHGGSSFFDWLFGGGPVSPPAAVPPRRIFPR